jgi:probable addiction module antidote protein
MPTQKGFDASKYRDNPAAIAEYLNSALATADLAQFVTAIGAMMRAQNFLALSEETGLNRENLYKMFAGHRDPKLGNTMNVLASLGVQFTIEPVFWAQPRPPRPKLGRRPKAGSRV